MVASLFGSHAAEPILASVHVRAQQKAGHMNASNRMTRTDFVNLARRGPSTYGTWWPWTRTRGTKKEPVDGDHRIFAFLTCLANDLVGSVHPKAISLLLISVEEVARRLEAPADEAVKFQRLRRTT